MLRLYFFFFFFFELQSSHYDHSGRSLMYSGTETIEHLTSHHQQLVT